MSALNSINCWLFIGSKTTDGYGRIYKEKLRPRAIIHVSDVAPRLPFYCISSASSAFSKAMPMDHVYLQTASTYKL